MITTGISGHVRYLFEEKGVRLLFESFVERRSLLKHPCDGLFFSTSAANETEKFKHLVQTIEGHRLENCNRLLRFPL